jgi:hypothetical protein
MLGQQSTAPGSTDRIAAAAENVDRLQRGASIVVIWAGSLESRANVSVSGHHDRESSMHKQRDFLLLVISAAAPPAFGQTVPTTVAPPVALHRSGHLHGLREFGPVHFEKA